LFAPQRKHLQKKSGCQAVKLTLSAPKKFTLTKWNNGIPTIILFDPQGNIIANDIRGPEIEDALSKIKF